MNSATLIVLLVANLWGIVTTFGILRKMRHQIGMRYNSVGCVKMVRLIMYFTVCCVGFALWQRHVHFTL